MKLILSITLLLLSAVTSIFGQTTSTCAIKIGGNYYINCKHIITFQNTDVLNASYSDNSIKPTFDIYSENGSKAASIVDGILTEGNKDNYTIKSTETEYSFIKKSANRIICLLKKTFDKVNNRFELQAWVDMYMPDGFYFQGTPETTNVPYLNTMTGSTFKNNYSCFSFQ